VTPRRRSAIPFLALLVVATPATAWHARGHRAVAAGAVSILPEELPAPFRASADSIAHHSVDPDVWRNRATPALTDATVPWHYVHLEEAEGTRAGELDRIIVELTERLTLTFAELRRRPDDPDLQAASRLIAGWLAHFAADLAQPLHTSIHHDGWALPDGSSPHAGIHATVDALVERVVADPAAAAAGLEPLAIEELEAALAAELAASHAELDAVYAALDRLAAGAGEVDAGTAALVCRRYRAAVRLLAGLFLHAWRRSAAIELPRWLDDARADREVAALRADPGADPDFRVRESAPGDGGMKPEGSAVPAIPRGGLDRCEESGTGLAK
jgi:hypothetical protein